MNLAGVLPWIHWRGAVDPGPAWWPATSSAWRARSRCRGRSPAAGCPAAGRGRAWLRSKWLAVGLIALFLWGYEAFALWDSPWVTAWIAIGYFVAAFVVDGFFRGAAFCKYVCPIGQFNFVQSLVSPLEVNVREPAVCAVVPHQGLHPRQRRSSPAASCTSSSRARPAIWTARSASIASTPARTTTSACSPSFPGERCGAIRSAPASADSAGGPTWRRWCWCSCSARSPTRRAWSARWSSGRIGCGHSLGNPPPLLVTTAVLFAAIVVLPLAAVGGAAAVSRAAGMSPTAGSRWRRGISFALVPLGFAMWLAHYSFHFLTSCDTIIPATQRFAADLAGTRSASHFGSAPAAGPPAEWVPHLEILMLDLRPAAVALHRLSHCRDEYNSAWSSA